MYRPTASILLLAAAVSAQQIGTLTAETHPKISVSKCSAGGTCTTATQPLVLDANWRWLHSTSGSTNCYTGNTWDKTLCPDAVTCAKNCAVDGADYAGTYGITTSGNALTLKFVTTSSQKNIGSRVYLMADDSTYQKFNLLNQEFTFDVDVSNLPCGLNGAVYFSQMDADGGLAKYSGNKAGAKYGTGYCDSQCPHDIKFINGEANNGNWTTSPNDPNSGSGGYGTCCAEMDIWEANSQAAAYTPHPCSVTSQTRCSGKDCGDNNDRYNGVCDKDGCDFNSYRMGNTSFLGTGKIVDTTKPFTIVTQFITNDNTATGTLTEIRRFYVQGGKTIPNSFSSITGLPAANSITDSFCTAQKTIFGDTNSFSAKGGLKAMGQAFQAGMVLVLSLWDDHAVNMLWLDSTYPTDGTGPGTARGACATTSGVPADVEANSPNASVVYSNIKTGPIGSTFPSGPGGGGTTTTSKPTTTTSTKPVTTTTTSSGSSTTGAPHYGQCGGIGWTGATTCVSPYVCTVSNPYYSQCL